jgi:hypothetical protein
MVSIVTTRENVAFSTGTSTATIEPHSVPTADYDISQMSKIDLALLLMQLERLLGSGHAVSSSLAKKATSRARRLTFVQQRGRK